MHTERGAEDNARLNTKDKTQELYEPVRIKWPDHDPEVAIPVGNEGRALPRVALLRNDHVGVQVRVHEVVVLVAADRPPQAHQAPLRRLVQQRRRVDRVHVAHLHGRVAVRVRAAPARVGLEPADVLALAEPPVAQRVPRVVQRVGVAPDEAEGHGVHDLVHRHVVDQVGQRPAELLLERPHAGRPPRRVDEHHVEEHPQALQVERAQVRVDVPCRRRPLACSEHAALGGGRRRARAAGARRGYFHGGTREAGARAPPAVMEAPSGVLGPATGGAAGAGPTEAAAPRSIATARNRGQNAGQGAAGGAGRLALRGVPGAVRRTDLRLEAFEKVHQRLQLLAALSRLVARAAGACGRAPRLGRGGLRGVLRHRRRGGVFLSRGAFRVVRSSHLKQAVALRLLHGQLALPLLLALLNHTVQNVKNKGSRGRGRLTHRRHTRAARRARNRRLGPRTGRLTLGRRLRRGLPYGPARVGLHPHGLRRVADGLPFLYQIGRLELHVVVLALVVNAHLHVPAARGDAVYRNADARGLQDAERNVELVQQRQRLQQVVGAAAEPPAGGQIVQRRLEVGDAPKLHKGLERGREGLEQNVQQTGVRELVAHVPVARPDEVGHDDRGI
ncbi:uncharacterized protein BcabD6B2_54620 [Babesia caballi]|uniref:Uncharacterized protein n=1 Tax=Babesia caballi TaxID=5871 RepID=A0AAV4M3S5_BABCB|nr:hypothetical protein BcabD6B2_54620 [Babesia caballi]